MRSGEGEGEEWRCLLVARLKVCSVTEGGAGGVRTSSRWLVRGVDDGVQPSVWLAKIGSSHVDASLGALRCLLSVALSARWQFRQPSTQVTAATSYPIRSSVSFRTIRPTGFES